MANTYTQIHIHAISVVKYREAMISKRWKTELHKYMTGIIQNQGHKLVAINSVPDHIHMLIGLRPVQSLSDLMEKVKGDSSLWINDHHLTPKHFNWQKGFSAFSVSYSAVDTVVKYIMNQEEHHQKKSFKEEHLDMLRENNVDFDEKYLFEDLQ